MRKDPALAGDTAREYLPLGISNQTPDLSADSELASSATDLRQATVRWMTWACLAECDVHPYADEFARYLSWKRRYDRRDLSARGPRARRWRTLGPTAQACRSLRRTIVNPWIWAGIGAILALKANFIYLLGMQDVFDAASLDAREWLQAAAAAPVLVPAIAVEEAVRRRFAPPGTA